jgi:hypothetical protein
MAKKTDNHNPEAKLKLRRYFLEKYHADGSARVFDCCQGGGVMWSTIRRTHPVASYWGVDVKPKKGRLKIDSIRVLQQGVSQDVIDIDTYGSPWKHWLALLPKVNKPVTVFLTSAFLGTLGCSLPSECKTALGIPTNTPPACAMKLYQLSVDILLSKAKDIVTIIEAVEVSSTGNARYIGVRLEPKSDGQQLQAADRQHTSVEKELKHV